MKLGIVTWATYHNYGTALQNFALQTTLNGCGCDVSTISDSEIIANEASTNSNRNWIRILKKLYFTFLLKPQNITRFLKYRNRHLSLEQGYNDFYSLNIKLDTRPLSQTYKDYEVVVCGSDQIWAPYENMSKEYYAHYFLANYQSKKIAYAPSIGALAKSTAFRNLVKPWLLLFDNISCREKSGTEELNKLLEKPVSHVLDPTLLLSGTEWEQLLRLNQQNDGHNSYVLCYFLSYRKDYLEVAQNYAKKHGLLLKVIITNYRFVSRNYDNLYPNPIEFLQLIHGATKIFTDSFHGSIFSILFHRNFTTFKRFNNDEYNRQNKRIESLFSLLGLDNHFVSKDNYLHDSCDYNYDYVEVERKLECLRNKSLDYLKNALGI